MPRAKSVVFAAIAVITAYVLYHNERFIIDPDHPLWEHYGAVGFWLIPHAAVGAMTLVLAPLQFSNRLRTRFTKAHRVGGRFYVAGVLILAPIGAWVQYQEEAMGLPRTFTVLAVVNAVMLYATTLPALFFAVQRRITLHRQWMTRSYAVALAFFTNRFIMGVTGLETASVEMQQAIIWTCLALAAIAGDIANDWHEFRLAERSRHSGPASGRAQPSPIMP